MQYMQASRTRWPATRNTPTAHRIGEERGPHARRHSAVASVITSVRAAQEHAQNTRHRRPAPTRGRSRRDAARPPAILSSRALAAERRAAAAPAPGRVQQPSSSTLTEHATHIIARLARALGARTHRS